MRIPSPPATDNGLPGQQISDRGEPPGVGVTLHLTTDHGLLITDNPPPSLCPAAHAIVCAMEELNYHHLMYFWAVVKDGTIAKACKRLNVGQPTISAQLKKLEQQLQAELFRKSGRRLELTEVGQQVFQYADEIFTIGQELQDVVQRGKASQRAEVLTIGISARMPATLANRLISPVLHLPQRMQVRCLVGDAATLPGDLAANRVQIVLTDEPLDPDGPVRAVSQTLGETRYALFGTEAVTERYRRNFPRSLEAAPLILPTRVAPLRRQLDGWLAAQHLRPVVVAESDDFALCLEFALGGWGLMPAPEAIAQDLARQFDLRSAGPADEITSSWELITLATLATTPPVTAILEAARQQLFRPQPRVFTADTPASRRTGT